MKFILSILLAFAFVTTATAADTAMAKKLLDASVTIDMGDQGHGSGTLFTRKLDNDTVTFVWTAGHCIDRVRTKNTVLIPGSKPISFVTFKDVQVIFHSEIDGKQYEEKLPARVIRYLAEYDGDLALLELRKRNVKSVADNIRFLKSDTPPPPGTSLFHVGSFQSQLGFHSFSEGIVSQVGRILVFEGKQSVFDQTSVTAYPGSSGGGVFIAANGDYAGMLLRVAQPQFNFIAPTRVIRAWARKANVEWAMNPDIPMPTAEALRSITIEDKPPGAIVIEPINPPKFTLPMKREDVNKLLDIRFPTIK